MSKLFRTSIILSTLLCGGTFAHAQKIVDPSKVAPEFREAAEKRRAEQLKQIACNKAADEQKIAPREKLKFVADCFDKPSEKTTDFSASARDTTPTPTPK